MLSTFSPSPLREPVAELAMQRPAEPGRPTPTDDGAPGNPQRHGVLEVPQLVAGKTSPMFSLVLLLSRVPDAGEDSIRPLLISSYLGMELSYRLPPDSAQFSQAQPVFARQARVSLHSAGQPAFATASLSAPLLRGALHTPLNREQTLAVLDALNDVPGPLELKAHVEYRATAPAFAFPQGVSPADLWDRFKAVAVEGALAENAFQQVFDQLQLAPELFPAFRRACDGLLVPSREGVLLGRRPAPGSSCLEEEWRLRAIDVSCALQAVLGNALSAADRTACISVVGPSGNLQGGLALETLRRSRSRASRGAVGMGAMLNMPAADLTVAGRKRLELARALANEPKLLLLDEVMAGLRPTETDLMVAAFRRLNAELGITILLIEHVMRAVMALAQRVYVLHHGEIIAQGTPQQVTQDPRVLESYLGTGAVH